MGTRLMAVFVLALISLTFYLVGWCCVALALLIAGGDVPSPIEWWSNFNTDDVGRRGSPILLAPALVGLLFSFIGKYAFYVSPLIGLIFGKKMFGDPSDGPKIMSDFKSKSGDNADTRDHLY